MSMLERFKLIVAAEPQRAAVTFRGTTLSYRDVDELSNGLAMRIRESIGSVRNGTVGVLMPHGLEVPVSFLAILKAGAAYMPLDAGYPAERLDWMVEAARPALVLTCAETAGTTIVESTKQLQYDVATAGRSSLPFESPALDDDLSYVIFTSGSTGKPKGILQTRRCLDNFLAWHVDLSGIPTRCRVVQFAPLCFDISVQEIGHSLLSGGCLFPVPQELRQDLSLLPQFMIQHGIQVGDFPYSVIRTLLACKPSLADVDTLTDLITAGEPTNFSQDMRELLARRPALRLHNHYGPAENHMMASHTVTAASADFGRAMPLGKLIPGVRGWVLDEAFNEVPVGSEGEIFIGGVGLARGYIDPELTRQKFVHHPRSGERMYRTRDLGKVDADGVFEMISRIDDMIKIHGYRVEPGEIEVALSRHPSIAAAVCLLAADKLVAFLQPASDQRLPDDGELRRFLSEWLPSYMVPTRFIPIGSIPLSPNGKADTRSLRAMALAGADAESMSPPAAPDSAMAALLGEVLGCPPPPTTANLLYHGLDSLKAALLSSRIRERLGCTISLADFFRNPTLARLEELLQAAKPAAGHDIPVSNPPVERWRLSQEQSMVFLQCASLEDEANFNACEVYRLPGTCAHEDVERAVAALLARHPVLRARVAWHEGQAWHEASHADAPPIASLSLSADATPHAELLRHAESLRQQPFDLENEIPVRFAFASSNGGDRWLLLSAHHMVSDAVSISLVAREVVNACKPEPRAQGPVAPRMADWLDWLSANASGAAAREGAAYWRRSLTDLARQPRVFARNSTAPVAVTLPPLAFEGDVVAALRRIAADMGVSVFQLLLGVFAHSVLGLHGTSECAIGFTSAGRSVPGTERIVGMFARALPVMARRDAEASFADFVRSLQDAAREAVSHEIWPTLDIKADIRSRYPTSAPMLFEAGFQLLPDDKVEEGERVASLFSTVHPGVLWLHGRLGADRIGLQCDFDPATIDPELAQALVKAFKFDVDALVDGSLDDLDAQALAFDFS